MVRSTVVGLVVVLLVVKAVTSLDLLSSHWEERTQTIDLGRPSAKAYEMVTPNGTVEFAGQDDHAQTVELVARCKAGANSVERAEQALAAIEVTTEGKDAETCRIGWRWRTPQESDWSAIVDFTLRAPQDVNLKVEAQNGRVKVQKLTGNVEVTAHNGQIDTDTSGESLKVEAQNGAITAKFSGHKVNIHSHNGRIKADLSAARAIEGELATHNGLVEIKFGKETSCNLVTDVKNGRRMSRHVRIGSGGGELVAKSHNGAVIIKDAMKNNILSIHGPSEDSDDDEE